MPTFRNLDELYVILDSPSKKVLKYITEKSINTIKDEIDRYGIGKGGDIYNPTDRVDFTKEETNYQIEILKELLHE